MTVLHNSSARSDQLSATVLDAALEFLGANPEEGVSAKNRAAFSEMLAFGERLRAALKAP